MRILVVTGASGGHIFPAASFISALKEKDNGIDSLLLLPARSLKSGVLVRDCRVKYISTPAFSAGFNSNNLIALGCLLKGFWECLRIILKYRPDLVVGFGSLDSVPCILLAWFFRIKTLIHEQNVAPGRANRLLAKFADKVAVSFEKTKEYFNIDRDKIVLTGNPLRSGLRKIDKNSALDFLGLERDIFTILIMGGSQGSRRVNQVSMEALTKIPDSSKIQAVHICGYQDYEAVKGFYKNLSLKVKLFPFLKEMHYAYSASDLAVCRAGASTIAELAYFNLPAVVIPYPFAYAHQYNNAKALEEEGGAVIINDADLESAKLGALLSGIAKDPQKLDASGRKRTVFLSDSAAEELARLALSLS